MNSAESHPKDVINSTETFEVFAGFLESPQALSPIQLEDILGYFVKAGASDIIICENHGLWILRHGVAEQIQGLSQELVQALFGSVLDHMKLKTTQFRGAAVEGGFEVGAHRFRISIFQQSTGGRMVLRVLSTQIPEPDQLNLPAMALKLITTLRQGLILICGPTGSGKTTTIASALKARGRLLQEHIVTLEDPVEYILPQNSKTIYSQRQIGRDEPSFAQGLRAALRQAPHVIVIGEVRDPATAAIALEASETGHLVIATIHANSADMTVHRYLQMIEPTRQQMAREQLAAFTELVICQKLCKSSHGYQGRTAIHEVMFKTPATMNCIRKGLWTELRNEILLGSKKGHVIFKQSLQELQALGKLSLTEYSDMLERLEGEQAHTP